MGTKVYTVHRENNAMNKKMGRPTDAIKDSVIKVRIDEQTKRMLEYCVKISSMSKSDVVRQGIENVYNELKGENKK